LELDDACAVAVEVGDLERDREVDRLLDFFAGEESASCGERFLFCSEFVEGDDERERPLLSREACGESERDLERGFPDDFLLCLLLCSMSELFFLLELECFFSLSRSTLESESESESDDDSELLLSDGSIADDLEPDGTKFRHWKLKWPNPPHRLQLDLTSPVD